MELDNLKEAWTSIDERLKEKDMLNKQMIQEMLSVKSYKSLNKLVNIELYNIISCLFGILIFAWALNFSSLNSIFLKPLLLTAIAIAILGITCGSYALKKYLLKIDFSKSIKDNIYYLNKFIIYYRKAKMINYYFIIPVLSVFGILLYYELKVSFYLWIFLFVVLTIAIVFAYWSYKKIYDANIQSIQKSLDEIRELKEE